MPEHKCCCHSKPEPSAEDLERATKFATKWYAGEDDRELQAKLIRGLTRTIAAEFASVRQAERDLK